MKITMTHTTEQLVIQRLSELTERIEQNAKEAREDRKGIEARLNELMTQGCAKASLHDNLDAGQRKLSDRVRAVEQAQAEGRGKLIVAMVFISGLLTWFFTWLGKRIDV